MLLLQVAVCCILLIVIYADTNVEPLPTPLPTTAGEPYTDMGCWRNKNPTKLINLEGTDKILDKKKYKNREDAITKCYVVALSSGYEYFGLGNKGQCWSGVEENYKHYGSVKSCPDHGKGKYGVVNIYTIKKLQTDAPALQTLSATPTVNLSNWMSDIDDETQVGQLTVPGTHDTAANHMTPVFDWGQTQDLNVAEQLSNGIRFMDIRIANKLFSDDDFELRHGILRLGSFKEDAMEPTVSFLDTFPEETVFMSIAPADDTDTDRLIKDFINEPKYKFYQQSVTGQTKIKDIRGKIVLFNRYDRDNNNIGIGWNIINNAGRIQDKYELQGNCVGDNCSGLLHGWNYTKKVDDVLNHFKELEKKYEESHFWFNFGSATDNIGRHIKDSAEVVNQAIKDHLEPAETLVPVGAIIPMDYPNHVPGCIENIIKRSLDVHGKETKE